MVPSDHILPENGAVALSLENTPCMISGGASYPATKFWGNPLLQVFCVIYSILYILFLYIVCWKMIGHNLSEIPLLWKCASTDPSIKEIYLQPLITQHWTPWRDYESLMLL